MTVQTSRRRGTLPSSGDPIPDASPSRALEAMVVDRNRRIAAAAGRVLLVLAGVFAAGTVCWIGWGIGTWGRLLERGNRLLEPSLSAMAVTGGFLAVEARSRQRQVLLAILTVACAVFWIAVPDDWWIPPTFGRPVSPCASGPGCEAPSARPADAPLDPRGTNRSGGPSDIAR